MTEFQIEQEIARLQEVNAGLHDHILDNEDRILELEFELDNYHNGDNDE